MRVGMFFPPLYFLVAMVFAFVLMPAQGFPATEEAFHTPDLALTYAAESPMRALDDLRDLILAAGLVLGGLYLFDPRDEANRGWHIGALVMAGGGAALLAGSGVAGFTAIPVLAEQYAENLPGAQGAYLALTLTTGGMRWAAWIAFGLWAGLASWAALRANRMPIVLAYLGMGLAVAAVLSLVLPDIAPLLIVALGIVWPAWVGVSYKAGGVTSLEGGAVRAK